ARSRARGMPLRALCDPSANPWRRGAGRRRGSRRPGPARVTRSRLL
ncbi:MAG: hypothetical protein AVDCRST_MAG73-1959, partial [uncultured Thermomicrobiales bacterium]